MDTAAERIFGFVRGATKEPIRRYLRLRSDNAQNWKNLNPKGFIKKPGGGFVAPQSKTQDGYSPSSRLAGARFLMKRRCP